MTIQTHKYSLTNLSFRLMVQLPKQQRLLHMPIIFRGFPFSISIYFFKFYLHGSVIFLNVAIYFYHSNLATRMLGSSIWEGKSWRDKGNIDLGREINGLHVYWQLQTANKWQAIPVKIGKNSIAVHIILCTNKYSLKYRFIQHSK